MTFTSNRPAEAECRSYWKGEARRGRVGPGVTDCLAAWHWLDEHPDDLNPEVFPGTNELRPSEHYRRGYQLSRKWSHLSSSDTLRSVRIARQINRTIGARVAVVSIRDNDGSPFGSILIDPAYKATAEALYRLAESRVMAEYGGHPDGRRERALDADDFRPE